MDRRGVSRSASEERGAHPAVEATPSEGSISLRAERPIRTAHFVALGRAIADAGVSHIADFNDPTARVFLNERAQRSLAKATRAAREGKRSLGLEMARGMADLIGLRTVAIDVAVREAI